MDITELRKKYAYFKIEYHRRYNGTYMLFGFQEDWKLLNETVLPNDADQWAQQFGCTVPDIACLANPDDPESGVVDLYEDCTCCKRGTLDA